MQSNLALVQFKQLGFARSHYEAKWLDAIIQRCGNESYFDMTLPEEVLHQNYSSTTFTRSDIPAWKALASVCRACKLTDRFDIQILFSCLCFDSSLLPLQPFSSQHTGRICGISCEHNTFCCTEVPDCSVM